MRPVDDETTVLQLLLAVGLLHVRCHRQIDRGTALGRVRGSEAQAIGAGQAGFGVPSDEHLAVGHLLLGRVDSRVRTLPAGHLGGLVEVGATVHQVDGDVADALVPVVVILAVLLGPADLGGRHHAGVHQEFGVVERTQVLAPQRILDAQNLVLGGAGG